MTSGGHIQDALQVPATASVAPSRGQIAEILSEVVSSKELIRQLVIRDLRVRYKQAVLGFAWAVFMPALIVGCGVLIRFVMSRMASAPFDRATLGTLTLKGLAWGFFVSAIGAATASIISNRNLVSKVYFPREALPLAATIATGVDTAMGTVLFLLLTPLFGLHLSAHLLWMPVLVVMYIALTVGVGLFLACANVFFRDVKYIVQTLLTFGIFFTPVFFEPVMLGPIGARLAMLNPLAPLLEGMRLIVGQGHNLFAPLSVVAKSGAVVVVWEPWYLVYSAVWAIGGLIGSALLFHRSEAAFPEYL
jgi:ABC-type polysaccharide/polyol phosphate export permease